MSYVLHAVVIKKPIELDEARKMAREYIPVNKKFYRETDKSFRFRNVPKQRFEKGSFRTKKIGKNLSLIFGELKTD